MAILKCKMCGGNLEVAPDSTVAVCEYCGTKQTVPSADNDKKMMMFDRANKLRIDCEFDKAAGIYESIIVDFPYEAEAYWGLVLCKYGIEYVDDPATGKKIATCHRSSFDSVMEDSNFDQVLENADSIAVSVYREEAKTLESLRKNIIEVSNKEEPYDVFICYKETDENGDRTLDSVIAQDIYKALVEEGYRVFFSRITLEDKLGTAYEPYIFAALNSSKVMLAVGTSYDHYNAVWVKNEWSRYLQLIAKGEKKTLIPCYKGVDAYDIPKEFKHLQAQDMGKVGAIQDLVRGVKKIISPKTNNSTQNKENNGGLNTVVAPLLKRIAIFLEDKDFKNAETYCEKVLDLDPENNDAYLYKLLAEQQVSQKEDLKDCREPFDRSNNYQKVSKYGSESLKSELRGYIDYINQRNTEEYNNGWYDKGVAKMNSASSEESFLAAAACFREIPNWKDSDTLLLECEGKAKNARNQKIYNEACELLNTSDLSNCEKALRLFKTIQGWGNADAQIEKCTSTIASIKEKMAIEQEEELQAIQKRERARKIKKAFVVIFVIIIISGAIGGIISWASNNNKKNQEVVDHVKNVLPGMTMTCYNSESEGFSIYYNYYKFVFNDDQTLDYYFVRTYGPATNSDDYDLKGTYSYGIKASDDKCTITVSGKTFELSLDDNHDPVKLKYKK